MIRKFLVIAIFVIYSVVNSTIAFAAGYAENTTCITSMPNGGCDTGLYCAPEPANPTNGICRKDLFGRVNPPEALKGFIGKDTTGAAGISHFLSNLIALFYSMAAIALVFMLVWGAFEWLTSGGSKEQLEKARNRIINAIIAILIFAAVFAILDVLGTFTGFQFFAKP